MDINNADFDTIEKGQTLNNSTIKLIYHLDNKRKRNGKDKRKI